MKRISEVLIDNLYRHHGKHGQFEDCHCEELEERIKQQDEANAHEVVYLEQEVERLRGIIRSGKREQTYRSKPMVNMTDDMVRITLIMTRNKWREIKALKGGG